MSQLFIISLIIGVGYVFFMVYGNSLHPHRKYYNRLFERNIYFLHLFVAFLVALVGLYLSIRVDARHSMLLAPVVFLIEFRIIDVLVQKLTGRRIIISDRWDSKPKNYRWYIDGICSFLLAFTPILVSGLILNKFSQGHFWVA
jgi:hypothetical protein